MKEWYLRQSPRDRLIVIALSAVVFLGLLYAMVWYPLNNSINTQRSAIESKGSDLAFLQKSVPILQSLRSGGSEIIASDKSPFQLLDQVTKEVDSGKPDQSQPVGADKVRMTFNNVAFDKLVSVIARMERYGIQIDTANLTRKKETGYVSARITMVRK